MKNRIFRLFPSAKHSLHCRAYLEAITVQNNPGILVNSVEDNECMFINGRIFADGSLIKFITKKKKENIVYISGDMVIAAYLSGSRLNSFRGKIGDYIDLENFEGVNTEIVEIKTFSYIWDLINYNGEELNREFEIEVNKKKRKNQKRIAGKVFDGVHLIEKKEIIIEKSAVVKPGVVIDASNGSVFIDKNVEVFPNAVIGGPVYIGESSKIKSAATIYENVSISKVCKIGGEVEGSIIMPYSNKQHAGFLGHAYLGSWVNIGADTNNSDLKNNYSTVKVYVNGEFVDSGSQFLGLVMGDHSKTAINTMFNTGTVVGFSCNIFGAGFPERFIPSFTWGGTGDSQIYDVERSINTAQRLMSRRNITMTADDRRLFHKIFELTRQERGSVEIA